LTPGARGSCYKKNFTNPRIRGTFGISCNPVIPETLSFIVVLPMLADLSRLYDDFKAQKGLVNGSGRSGYSVFGQPFSSLQVAAYRNTELDF